MTILHVLALQNNVSSAIPSKDRHFQTLTTNQIPGVETMTLPIPLFFMDKDHLLDSLLFSRSYGFQAHTMQHQLHNQESKALFRRLKQMFTTPHAYTLIDMTTDDSPKTHKRKATVNEISTWFNQFLQLCQDTSTKQ
jgi:hypothetical protein